jgi:DNA-binding transcriptional MerR regulator
MSLTPPIASSNETSGWHRPAAAAGLLAISTATLRRWSRQFGEFLSPEAAGRNGRRLYSEADLQVLAQVHELLHMGLSYEQARRQLRHRHFGVTDNGNPAATTLVLTDGTASMSRDGEHGLAGTGLSGIVAQVLRAMGEGQQLILAQQQSLRQLLGVLVQDNLHLKDENNRLRERILEAERKLFELKRELAAGQAQERERMRQMEAALFDLRRQLDGLAASAVPRRPEPVAMPTETTPEAHGTDPPPAASPRRRWWQRLRAWLDGA